eukprot:gene28281-31941_t
MRLLSRLYLFYLLAFNGLRHVQGRLGDVKNKVLDDETPLPTIEPTDMPIEIPPTEEPTDMPIYTPPINADNTGAVCQSYHLFNSNQQTCEFEFCGGSVTITQCSDDYTGSTFNGGPSCSTMQATNLQLYYNGQLLASDSSGSGSCSCSEIVHTLEDACRTYQLVQSCANGGIECMGATAIFSTPEDDDNVQVGTSVTAAGDGGLCDSFSIDQNSDQDVACQFQACAPFVITQCSNDGFNTHNGMSPDASGGSNNKIELFKVGDTTLLASDQNSGPCYGPRIFFQPTESGCHTYKVRQTCANGATDCTGLVLARKTVARDIE